MYYLPQPPFLIPLFGLFIALICGLTFKTLVEQRIQQWLKNPDMPDRYRLKGSDLSITYWGICLGIWIFLGGGLQIFSINWIVAYGLGLLLTIGTSGLISKQFTQLLMQVEKGGSKSLDLDFFS
jgi:hypothetical protein